MASTRRAQARLALSARGQHWRAMWQGVRAGWTPSWRTSPGLRRTRNGLMATRAPRNPRMLAAGCGAMGSRVRAHGRTLRANRQGGPAGRAPLLMWRHLLGGTAALSTKQLRTWHARRRMRSASASLHTRPRARLCRRWRWARGQVGMLALPPGGVGLEPWLWRLCVAAATRSIAARRLRQTMCRLRHQGPPC